METCGYRNVDISSAKIVRKCHESVIMWHIMEIDNRLTTVTLVQLGNLKEHKFSKRGPSRRHLQHKKLIPGHIGRVFKHKKRVWCLHFQCKLEVSGNVFFNPISSHSQWFIPIPDLRFSLVLFLFPPAVIPVLLVVSHQITNDR